MVDSPARFTAGSSPRHEGCLNFIWQERQRDTSIRKQIPLDMVRLNARLPGTSSWSRNSLPWASADLSHGRSSPQLRHQTRLAQHHAPAGLTVLSAWRMRMTGSTGMRAASIGDTSPALRRVHRRRLT